MHPQSPRPAPGPLLSDMDGESAAKLESGTAIVKSEFKYDLADLVLQVQADFNDSIAVAGRRVFPKPCQANKYLRTMRAAQATLSKKTITRVGSGCCRVSCIGWWVGQEVHFRAHCSVTALFILLHSTHCHFGEIAT